MTKIGFKPKFNYISYLNQWLTQKLKLEGKGKFNYIYSTHVAKFRSSFQRLLVINYIIGRSTSIKSI